MIFSCDHIVAVNRFLVLFLLGGGGELGLNGSFCFFKMWIRYSAV